MLTRQKILLRLLADSNGCLTRIRLVKLAFLLSQQGQSECLRTFYEFLPYLYGPYSFTLNHELDNLLRAGAVSLPDRDKVELTVVGQKLAQSICEPRLLRDIELLKNEYGNLNQSSLMDVVYEKFPWFTLNSAKLTQRKVKKTSVNCENYTIGYQGLQVDGLLNTLLKSGIGQLIDTRLNPVSRRYGFHKSTLFSLCQKMGIEYVHVPEVGVPSEWRQELESEEDYQVLFKRYESEILDVRFSILNKLASDVARKPSALLCRELECHHCHRSRLAKRLSVINGLPVNELNIAYARTI